jgi:hypothetical protein
MSLPLKKPLSGFHQWADGKRFEGDYLMASAENIKYWLLIIEWNRVDNFYVVLFPKDRSCPAAEIHKVTRDANGYILK